MTDCEVSSEKPCGVPWCNKPAYPGSDWCQFHEVVNPFDDQGPQKPERGFLGSTSWGEIDDGP